MANREACVAVVGLGRVGLCFATCLASRGVKVIGVDVDEEKLRLVSRGKAPFYEPGLSELLVKALESRRLSLTSSAEEASEKAHIIFVTVGTPSKPNGSVDLSQVTGACESIGRGIAREDSWRLVVIRSTVPPGTTSGLVRELLERASGGRCGCDFGLCMNPEFLSEGSAVEGVLRPDRIIIGEFDRRSGETLQAFYETFYGPDRTPPILRTSLTSAELIKYANNAFLAMKISFANMIAHLCQVLPGADVVDVVNGIGMDKRIGRAFLNAGLGWGGPCFPKDLAALLRVGEELGVNLPLVRATIEVNEEQPLLAVRLAKEALGDLKGRRVAVLGLSFKPNTDDVRGAVSLKVIEALLAEGASVVAYDPRAMDNVKPLLGNRIEFANSALEAVEGADCCIIVTEWDEFSKLRPEDLKKRMRNPVVIDGRRVFRSEELERVVKYIAIGRGPTPSGWSGEDD